VQGTINGVGERGGNVNLCSVIANLQLKMDLRVVSPASLRRLQELSRFVDELANIEHNKRQAYVGQSAFAHKGGVHVAAVQRNARTYEHIAPELVGNTQRVLVSDLSGRANILYKARQFGIDGATFDGHVRQLVEEVKRLEHQGFQFEGAEASLELRMHRIQHGPLRYFELVQFRVVDEKGYMRTVVGERGDLAVKSDERIEHDPASAWAAVMLKGPTGEIEHTAAEGNGPVNALDTALRRALRRFYPRIEEVRLLDYKVRVLGGGEGSAAPVRVLIESGDGRDRWGTVGVSLNVIEASWQALVDGFEYKLYQDARRGGRRARPAAKRAAAAAGRRR
jgi:2-isopropylmalate synthase